MFIESVAKPKSSCGLAGMHTVAFLSTKPKHACNEAHRVKWAAKEDLTHEAHMHLHGQRPCTMTRSLFSNCISPSSQP